MMGADSDRPETVGREFRQLLQKSLADEGMVGDGECHFTDWAWRLIRRNNSLRTLGLKPDGDFPYIMQRGEGGGASGKKRTDIV
jgi:hypothetical protein